MIAQQLERVGRDAEREIAVEGRHGVQPARLCEPHGLLARILEILAVFDQLRAERAHRGVLLARIAVRDDNRHREAGAPSGEGEALAVIAARRRDQAFRLRRAAHERVYIGEAAANLERAGRLVVLVLDHNLGADPFAKQRPGKSRRRPQRPLHDLMRPPQLIETEHRPHPATSATPASCPSRR